MPADKTPSREKPRISAACILRRHSGARVKRANPESRNSPMRNCAFEVWSFGPSTMRNCASENDEGSDQRATVTVVPTETR
jgi:hypothetical protein